MDPAPRPATNDRYQFSLWRLLVLVTAAAIVFAAWRALGVWSLLGLGLAGVLALPAVWRPRWLYVWLVPIVWTAVVWTNYRYPGDEYGGFGGGAMAGLWSLKVLGITDPHRMLPPILLAGAATVAAAGALMDKLRAPWVPWIVLMLTVSTAFFAWWFGSFPSVERALGKNGSYQAYVLPSINIGIYAATLVVLPCTAIYRFARWIQCRVRTARGAPR